MKTTTSNNSFLRRIKSIKKKDIVAILGTACFMVAGTLVGFAIHGPIGGSFGLILGYVLGRAIIS